VPSVRKQALKALEQVISDRVQPKDAVDAVASGSSEPSETDRRDRAFIQELVGGTLRNFIKLKWIANRYLDKPQGVPESTHLNIMIALHQILHLRVPDWAAVNEAVDLEVRFRGLVNAVLRNALRQRDTLEAELAGMERSINKDRLHGQELVQAASITTSHPEWIVRRWINKLGAEDAMALMRANNLVPSMTLRINTLRTTQEEVIEKLNALGMEAAPTTYSPVGVRLASNVPFRELKPLSGQVMVQDEAAQLMTMLLGLKPGARVLDACSAPGGKAAHMTELTGDTGEVLALELDEKRVGLIQENIERMGYESVRAVQGDAAKLKPEELGLFDAVLIDAPCSSLGVLRRNPDIKTHRKEAELEGFQKQQLRILNGAARMLKPEGTLVYCTCSTEPEEGEEVIEAFLRARGDSFIIEDVSDIDVFEKIAQPGNFVRTWPHLHGMDGFFASRLKKLK